MRPMIIDTNAYTAFKRGDEEIVKIIQNSEVIGISSIVLGELLIGFDGGNKKKQNRLELLAFLESSRVRIFNVNSDTSEFFSQIHFSLKQKGKPIPTNDMWIAAQVLEHGAFLCTYDKHFREVEGILVVNSIADLPI